MDTYIIEEIPHHGSGAGAETELDPATSWNHMWTEPPLQHEDTGRARHVIAGGMVGKDAAGVV